MAEKTVVGWDPTPVGRFAINRVIERESAGGELLLVRVVGKRTESNGVLATLERRAAEIVLDTSRSAGSSEGRAGGTPRRGDRLHPSPHPPRRQRPKR